MGYAKVSLTIYMFSVFLMGAQFACQQVFVALGQAKVSLFLALLRKIILLVPLIYILPIVIPDNVLTTIQQSILPMSLENKVFAVFLAEPISDFIAAFTTITLFIITTKKLNAQFKDKNICEKTN